MKRIHNPNGVPAVYSDGIEIAPGARTLYVAGQVGIAADKTIPDDIGSQTRQLFANLEAVLRSARMSLDDIVKTTVFIVDPADYAEFSRVRTEIMGARVPASTLVYVKQLIWPQLRVEIEAIASAP
ncbi:MAG TPA: RidA family protein [Steroidobacter sp.]|uniref:RidA family protein n=1 Tax=Steroidobacter sp. TaxID=1978227 RepID=UPI002ED77D6B